MRSLRDYGRLGVFTSVVMLNELLGADRQSASDVVGVSIKYVLWEMQRLTASIGLQACLSYQLSSSQASTVA